MNTIKAYFKNTNTLLYSFLFSLPLLLLYEILILVSQPSGESMVRISVDVWIKTLFSVFGTSTLSITLLVVAVLGAFILYKERDRFNTLRFGNFFILLIECTILAVVVAFLSQNIVQLVLNANATGGVTELSYVQKIALSLGAGLYEELFFRVLLVSALIWIFNKLFTKKWASITAAVVLSATLFSAVHYIGSLGDPFTIGSFLYRFTFGLFLNLIYVLRGFGVAAWTHAIYDLLVITFFAS